MDEEETSDFQAIEGRIRSQVEQGQFLLTQHAQQEMVEEEFTLDDLVKALASGRVLEDYPHHKRGSCCLIGGETRKSRHVHIVCTTSRPELIIITVYEPKEPKWVTPFRRR